MKDRIAPDSSLQQPIAGAHTDG